MRRECRNCFLIVTKILTIRGPLTTYRRLVCLYYLFLCFFWVVLLELFQRNLNQLLFKLNRFIDCRLRITLIERAPIISMTPHPPCRSLGKLLICHNISHIFSTFHQRASGSNPFMEVIYSRRYQGLPQAIKF